MKHYDIIENRVLYHVGKRLTIDNVDDYIMLAEEIFSFAPEVIALDFKNIEAIDSSGISFLVYMSKASKKRNFELFFYNVGEALGRLFSAAGLDPFFNIVEDEILLRL